jgi:predicted nucleotidyltransferase
MTTDLALLAEEVQTNERTLRRAANRGTIRCDRAGPRRISLPTREYEYVRTRWPLLASLIRALRTLPHVRLAVLYGSLARGEERSDSDIDVLVRFREDTIHARALVAERLERAVGRRVQLVSIDDAPPLLLADVLRDGRVLVDRDGDWPRLKATERRVREKAKAAERDLNEAAWSAMEELGVL